MQRIILKEFSKIPNLVTLARIFLSLVIFVLLVTDYKIDLIKWIFLAGVATDTLDGQLARLFRQITRLGIVLEPIADTLLVFATVLFIAFRMDFPIWIFVIYLIIFFIGFLNLLAIYIIKKKWFAEKLVASEVSIFFIYATGIFYLFDWRGKFYLAFFSVILGLISLIDFLRHLFRFNKKLARTFG